MNTSSSTLTFPPEGHDFFLELKTFSELRVSGTDAAQFLQGQLSCDVNAVNHHHSSLGACCDRKGRVLFSFRLLLQEHAFILQLPTLMLESALSHLKKYAVFSKVGFETRALSAIGLGGKGISQLLPNQFPELRLPTQRGCVEAIKNYRFLCIDETYPRYVILATAEQLLTLRKTFSKELHEADPLYWEYCDIQQGWVTIYPETQGLFIPQMLSYEQWGAVSFTKGCYVGQEIIARTQHLGKLKRHLQFLHTEKSYSRGEDILNSEGKSLGIVANLSPSPKGGYAAFIVTQIP